MIDLRQLRYFIAIAEHRSLSRAAEALHVAQPALSLHVRNMEAHLGTTLLFRSPRGVEPTEAGALLVRHARIILDQLAVAEEEIRGQQSTPSGEVRLGLPGTISQILAVPLITAVHRRHPAIQLRVVEAMSGFVREWLRAGRVDLAVLYLDSGDRGIRTEPVLEEELRFFGAPHNVAQCTPLAGAAGPLPALPDAGVPIGLSQIVQMPLILPGTGHGLRDLLDRVAQGADLTMARVFDVDSYLNIKELVAEGLGWSILPENAIAPEIATGRLRGWPIVDPTPRRRVHMAHAVDRPMTNAVSAVRAIARETLRDLVCSGAWSGATILAPQEETA